jgi:outer membrane receptor protein involved in Fe transport
MKIILVAATTWLLAVVPALAQQSGGTIAGRVLDQQGGAIPGATVTARNPETGLVRIETTDNAGGYRLAALPVAAYEVRVEIEGFQTVSHQDVAVNVGQTQSIDYRLRIAGIAQDVTVTGTTPLIDATSSSVGQVVDPRRMQDLPINGRQFANLAATLPGVGLAFHSDPSKGSNYAPLVNGGAGRNINYQIDGGDNNDDTVGGLLQQFPLEAIEEFHFETQRFKAEYGRSNGGVMNVVTKSGTNRFQGTLFELFRDKAMNALTTTERLAALAAGTNSKKGDYRRNQFGGSFGGPVMLDRVHFFFALERTQQDTTQTVNTKGLFPAQDGVYPTRYRDNLSTVKVSTNVNSSQYFAVRYGRNDNSFPFGASPTTTLDNWADAQNRFNSFNVNHNWVLDGAKLNEVVFQYSNFTDFIAERTKTYNQSFPNGVTKGSNLSAPQRTEQVKYQIRDDFSWLVPGHGGVGHTFKAGVNFINEPRLFIEGTSGKGVTAYTMLESSLTSPVFSVIKIDGEAAANIPTKQYGFYLQDDWRAGPRLTVNAGVRYDLITGLNFDQSKNPNFVKVQAAATAGLLNGIVGLENFGLDSRSDRNNIQPRIGGVYDVTGTATDIVRAGWGIYTDFGYTNSNVLQAALDASGNRFGTEFSASNTKGLRNVDGSFYQVGQDLGSLADANKSAGGPPVIGIWVDPRLEQPYQRQTNLGWSHQLTSTTVLGVDFVNSIGRNLNYKPRLNQLIPGTQISRISTLLSSPLNPDNSSNRPALSRGHSEYNALMFSGRRRFANGFDFAGSYMLSKAVSTIGNASDELNTANIQDPNDPFDNPVQLGPNVTTDARHRINLSAVVQLPYGVQVAPFFLYRSALPIFLVDGRDVNKDGDRIDIPQEAFAVESTDPVTGKATRKSLGPCETVNCGRGWGQSQLNLRVSKVFALGRAKIEAIGEMFNLLNAINPSNIVGGVSANRTLFNTAGVPQTSLLQPASFSGDSQRPEQRVGQIGLRFSF